MNTRRYPRSMAEAFGPYTDNVLFPMPERRVTALDRLIDRLLRWIAERTR